MSQELISWLAIDRIDDREYRDLMSVQTICQKGDLDQLLRELRVTRDDQLDVQWLEKEETACTDLNSLNISRFTNWAPGEAMDGLISKPRAYLLHRNARCLFMALLKQSPSTALEFLERKKDETPAKLVHALWAGAVVLEANVQIPKEQAGKRPALVSKQSLFSPNTAKLWHSLLGSKNPIFRALAIQLASRYELDDNLLRSLDGALRSNWVSLQFIGLEAAESIKPPGAKKVIEEYAKAKHEGIPEEVTKQLNEKTQSVLQSLAGEK